MGVLSHCSLILNRIFSRNCVKFLRLCDFLSVSNVIPRRDLEILGHFHYKFFVAGTMSPPYSRTWKPGFTAVLHFQMRPVSHSWPSWLHWPSAKEHYNRFYVWRAVEIPDAFTAQLPSFNPTRINMIQTPGCILTVGVQVRACLYSQRFTARSCTARNCISWHCACWVLGMIRRSDGGHSFLRISLILV